MHVSVIDDDGRINENGKFFIGEDRSIVRKKIIKKLINIDHLVKQEKIMNKVGFSERTNVVIEPKISMQWFFDVKEISQPALKAVMNNEINFFPDNFNDLNFSKGVSIQTSFVDNSCVISYASNKLISLNNCLK